eukprot:10785794-Alexandrium_andersonii.AAC.1
MPQNAPLGSFGEPVQLKARTREAISSLRMADCGLRSQFRCWGCFAGTWSPWHDEHVPVRSSINRAAYGFTVRT